MCNRFKGSILKSGTMISYCAGLSPSGKTSEIFSVKSPTVSMRLDRQKHLLNLLDGLHDAIGTLDLKAIPA